MSQRRHQEFVGSRKLEAAGLVDTSAEVTILSARWAKYHGLVCQGSSVPFIQGVGGFTPVEGVLRGRLLINSQVEYPKQKFLVADIDDLQCDVLLGKDFLDQAGAVIDFGDKEFHFQDQTLGKVRVAMDRGSQARMVGNMEERQLLDPGERLKLNIKVPTVIRAARLCVIPIERKGLKVEIEQRQRGRLSIRLINTSSSCSLYLHRGLLLFYLETPDCIPKMLYINLFRPSNKMAATPNLPKRFEFAMLKSTASVAFEIYLL